MNKKAEKFLKVALLVAVLLLGIYNVAKADDTTASSTSDVTLPPICIPPQTLVNNICTDPAPNPISTSSSTTLNVQVQVDVPASCSATDTDGVVHNYPQNSSSNSYLAICALEAVIKNGSVSNVQLSNQYPTIGLFIASINGITADPNSQYWAIYQNGSYAALGLTLLPVAPGDTIMFQLHDFSDNNLGNQVTLNIHSLMSNNPSNTTVGTESGGGIIAKTTTPKPSFDTKKALDFLLSQQKADGSFGEPASPSQGGDMYTDWATMAFASNPNYQGQKTKLAAYFSQNKLSGSSLTDYERHAMALMSLNLNPYNTNNENYIKDIISNFDGKQFGDTNQDNDDIFALIVLQNAGYTQADKIISSDISFVLGAQNENGSWDGSIDMTGSAIEALSAFSPTPGVGEGLAKAENFLKQNQKNDGSWNDNTSSTAWAIEGILSQGEKPANWTKNGTTPFDYLATMQDVDGGVKDLPAQTGTDMQTKIWETSYVASALSGKTWNQIMQKFGKPDITIAAQTPLKATATITKKIAFNKTPIQKLEKPASQNIQNTASVINAVDTPSPTTPVQTPKKNWFLKLLGNIFGSF